MAVSDQQQSTTQTGERRPLYVKVKVAGQEGPISARPGDPDAKEPYVLLEFGRGSIKLPVADMASLNAFLAQLREAILEVRSR